MLAFALHTSKGSGHLSSTPDTLTCTAQHALLTGVTPPPPTLLEMVSLWGWLNGLKGLDRSQGLKSGLKQTRHDFNSLKLGLNYT